MTDRAYLHVTYTSGPFKLNTPVLGGEGFHAIPFGGDTYRIDNVLFGTDVIGLHDVVRAEHDGKWLEVTSVVRWHPCVRGVVAFKHDDAAHRFHKEARERFSDDTYTLESWISGDTAPAAFQVEPEAWEEFEEFLNTHPAVSEYGAAHVTHEGVQHG